MGSFCLQNPCTFLCTRLWVANASIITVLLPRRKESERCRVLLKVSQEFIIKRAGVNNLTLKSSSFQHTWLNPVNYKQGETGIYMLVPKERKYTKPLQLILLELVSPIHAAVEDIQEDRILLIMVVCISFSYPNVSCSLKDQFSPRTLCAYMCKYVHAFLLPVQTSKVALLHFLLFTDFLI